MWRKSRWPSGTQVSGQGMFSAYPTGRKLSGLNLSRGCVLQTGGRDNDDDLAMDWIAGSPSRFHTSVRVTLAPGKDTLRYSIESTYRRLTLPWRHRASLGTRVHADARNDHRRTCRGAEKPKACRRPLLSPATHDVGSPRVFISLRVSST